MDTKQCPANWDGKNMERGLASHSRFHCRAGTSKESEQAHAPIIIGGTVLKLNQSAGSFWFIPHLLLQSLHHIGSSHVGIMLGPGQETVSRSFEEHPQRLRTLTESCWKCLKHGCCAIQSQRFLLSFLTSCLPIMNFRAAHQVDTTGR